MLKRSHPCPVCQTLTSNPGMCDACKKRRQAAGITKPWERSSRTVKLHRLYYTTRWKHVRAQALARDKHLCRSCLAQGKAVSATEVDHIIPTSQGGSMFDLSNLQSLCHACHELKTKRERGRGRLKSYGIGLKHRPA